MIEVAALTSGRHLPSSRFRVRQHIPGLLENGFRVREYAPVVEKNKGVPGWPEHLSPKYILPIFGLWQGLKVATRIPGVIGSWRSDLTWLGREMLPGYLTLEPLLKRPLLLDVDDAIWLARPWGAKAVAAIARRADLVIAGNTIIAEWFAPYARRIEIVPTAVDCMRFHPQKSASKKPCGFTIGWIGTAGNLPYLEGIEASLATFLKRHDDADLLVVADRAPSFASIPANRWRFQPWRETEEVAAINSMDVGLMPLPDNEWTRGKCSFKMLQYMACGKPVVVSPVGMNASLLNSAHVGFSANSEDEWLAALEELYENPLAANTLGMNGRQVVARGYSLEVVGARLAELMGGVL